MKNVIFIIGLPASGKSFLCDYYRSHPFIDYIIYDDWMKEFKIKEKVGFGDDSNYDQLIKNISLGKNIIISCIDFCNNDYLLNAQNILTSQFPELEIERIYFENNLENVIVNIKQRDKKRGGYWKDGVYFGLHLHNEALYKREIRFANMLSENYTIPSNYSAFPVKTSME